MDMSSADKNKYNNRIGILQEVTPQVGDSPPTPGMASSILPGADRPPKIPSQVKKAFVVDSVASQLSSYKDQEAKSAQGCLIYG